MGATPAEIASAADELLRVYEEGGGGGGGRGVVPEARHELEHAVHPPMSGVRKFTLIGALSGVTFGFWVAIWGSNYWPLVVGGKAISTWLPYVVFGMHFRSILFLTFRTIKVR